MKQAWKSVNVAKSVLFLLNYAYFLSIFPYLSTLTNFSTEPLDKVSVNFSLRLRCILDFEL